MVQEIVHDMLFLAQKSEPATKEDAAVAQDLKDTLEAHKDECVGLAANMIGVKKNIIIFDNKGVPTLMYNPLLIKASGEYQTKEGCLSLEGIRETRRFHSIIVKYQDESFKSQVKSFTGWTAQIIQHELDHLKGILI